MPLNLAGANTPVVAGGITTVPQDFGDVEAEADKPTSTNVQYRWDNTTVSLAAGEALTADVQFNTYPPDTKHYHDFRVVYAPTAKGSSSQLIVFAFWPHKVGSTKATITLKVNNIAKYVFNLTGNGIAPVPPASTATCNAPRNTFLPLTRLSVILPGQDLPEGSEQLAQELAWKATQQLGDPLASNIWEASINCFYSTNKALAFFTQIRSTYNGGSSTTVSANIGSYNFPNGMQLTLGTNVQAGPSGTGSAPVNGVPVLAAAGAAQAAQNVFYGGNFYLSGLYPIIANPTYSNTRVHFDADLVAREGVDLQNFTAGTDTTASSPNSHFYLMGEFYWQYDAIPVNLGEASPMSIFLGGQYGYSYTSAGYARQYGFGKNTSAGIGDISAGVIINSMFTVQVLHEFGPSQNYIDSTTNKLTHVNNFQNWSFSIWYQNKGLGSSK
jgi:hypothetical protein